MQRRVNQKASIFSNMPGYDAGHIVLGCGMVKLNIDKMTEFALEYLAEGDHDKMRSLVRDIARKWPGENALKITFAITSAAAHLEDNFEGKGSHEAIARGYQLAALLAADIYAVNAMGKPEVKGIDLMHFWRRVDPFFLK